MKTRRAMLMVLNPLLLLLLLYQGFTGFLKSSFYELFHATHAITGGLLLVSGLLHLALNWSWVTSSFFRR